MTLTKEEIKEKLKEIQTDLNKEKFTDDLIDHYSKFIYQDRNGEARSEKEMAMYLSFITDENMRHLVKDYSHVSITENGTGLWYINAKKNGKLYSILKYFVKDSHAEEIKAEVFRLTEVFNKILTQGYVTTEINFPTGELIFANYFKNTAQDDYAFEVPEHLKYKEPYSINHSLGEQNTMDVLSRNHGLGYVQLGNTSAAVYKVTDDKLVMVSPWAFEYDEEKEMDVDIPVSEDWQYLGEISCDVWRVEFIDKENFNKGDALPLDHESYEFNKPFEGKVNPGTWQVKNYYHFTNDRKATKLGQVPIWVEIERIDK